MLGLDAGPFQGQGLRIKEIYAVLVLSAGDGFEGNTRIAKQLSGLGTLAGKENHVSILPGWIPGSKGHLGEAPCYGAAC